MVAKQLPTEVEPETELRQGRHKSEGGSIIKLSIQRRGTSVDGFLLLCNKIVLQDVGEQKNGECKRRYSG